MSLVAQSYFIFSGPNQVGRHPIEDRSLNPKAVRVLPPGVEPLAPWRVEPTDDGCYKLLALGAPTAEAGGLLWAFLTNEDRDFNWVITSRGNNSYTIEKPGGGPGWVATGEDSSFGAQIAVRPLMPGGPDQLFKFIPA